MSKAAPDTLTQAGAATLAKRIENFWLARGFAGIECRLEQQVTEINGKSYATFWVRSNLNEYGYPPKFAALK
jgi:hypothetical protein